MKFPTKSFLAGMFTGLAFTLLIAASSPTFLKEVQYNSTTRVVVPSGLNVVVTNDNRNLLFSGAVTASNLVASVINTPQLQLNPLGLWAQSNSSAPYGFTLVGLNGDQRVIFGDFWGILLQSGAQAGTLSISSGGQRTYFEGSSNVFSAAVSTPAVYGVSLTGSLIAENPGNNHTEIGNTNQPTVFLAKTNVVQGQLVGDGNGLTNIPLGALSFPVVVSNALTHVNSLIADSGLQTYGNLEVSNGDHDWFLVVDGANKFSIGTSPSPTTAALVLTSAGVSTPYTFYGNAAGLTNFSGLTTNYTIPGGVTLYITNGLIQAIH